MSTTRDDGKGSEIPIQMPDNHHQQLQQQKCVSLLTIIDWKHIFYWCYMVVFLLCMASCVVLSLSSVDIGQHKRLGLTIWQWSFLVTTIIGGPIISLTLRYITWLLLEYDRSLEINFIYYIVKLSGSIAYLLWSSTVLFAWIFISYFHYEVGSHKETIISQYYTNPKNNTTMVAINLFHQETKTMVTITLVSLLICSILWLLKDLAIILMKYFFHSRVFFIRTKEVATHHQALKLVTNDAICLKKFGDNIVIESKCDQFCKKQMVIDDKGYLKKVDKETVACWKMDALIKEIKSTKFMYMKTNEGGSIVIDSNDKAIEASYHLKETILGYVNDHQSSIDNSKDRIIQKDDFNGALQALLQWFNNDGLRAGDHLDIKNAPKLIEWASERQKLKKYMELDDGKILKNYMVWIFNYHGALVRALVNNEDLFIKLNICLNFVLILATIILWLIMAKKTFKNVIFVIGSAIVGSSFALKGIVDKMINSFLFVFLMHPFDVGDYCLIDNIMVIVDRINLLYTEATTFDDQKIHLSNTILAGKDIINYTRGSNTRDSVVLYLDKRTTEAQIKYLKDGINRFIDEQSRYWDKEHELVLETELESIKATLYIKHKLNYYDHMERKMRKSILIEKLNSILSMNELYNNTAPVSSGGAHSQSSLTKAQENEERSSDDDDDDDNITKKSSLDKQPSTSNQADLIEDNGQN